MTALVWVVRLTCSNCNATGRAKTTSGYGSGRCPKCDNGYIELVCPTKGALDLVETNGRGGEDDGR